MEVTPAVDQDDVPLSIQQNQAQSSTDIKAQVMELEKALGSGSAELMDTKEPESVSALSPEPTPTTGPDFTPGSVVTPEPSLVQTLSPSHPESGPSEAKELQEGEEIYIQTEGLTVQLAEPGSEGIVIVNGPDGTTMHIQTPEGVPLEAVQALLGIEASDGAKAPQ